MRSKLWGPGLLPPNTEVEHLSLHIHSIWGVIKDDCCTELFRGNGNSKVWPTNGLTDGLTWVLETLACLKTPTSHIGLYKKTYFFAPFPMCNEVWLKYTITEMNFGSPTVNLFINPLFSVNEDHRSENMFKSCLGKICSVWPNATNFENSALFGQFGWFGSRRVVLKFK